jgi:hypothetical protein
MGRWVFLMLFGSAFCLLAFAAKAQVDQGVDAACVMPPIPESQSATYPVRLEIRGDDAKALGSGVVTVSHSDGRGLISVDCAKPRVIMRLAPGSYIATVDPAAGPTRTLRFQVLPSQGTRTLTLHFPPLAPALTAH